MHPATTIELPFLAGKRSITAGSYRNYPGAGFYGVKLAPEVHNPADLIVPIPDFGLPKEQDMYSALRVALYRIAMGQKVYVGCMGGYGRTGTFLALLYRTLGVRDPITHLRSVYCPHAVETSAQKAFVANLPLAPLHADILRAQYFVAMRERMNGNGGARKGDEKKPRSKKKPSPPLKHDWSAGPEPRWLP